jgi:uncharacterized protein YegL
VLEEAVKPDGFDADGRRRPETVLVITDGEPSDRAEVEDVIIRATQQYMQADEDLSITFVQIGNDAGASRWLNELDEGLQKRGARFDCVDVMGYEDMKGTDFVEFIRMSLQD